MSEIKPKQKIAIKGDVYINYNAAPDMLKALETICDEVLDLSFDHVCLIKDAIRKARGIE